MACKGTLPVALGWWQGGIEWCRMACVGRRENEVGHESRLNKMSKVRAKLY